MSRVWSIRRCVVLLILSFVSVAASQESPKPPVTGAAEGTAETPAREQTIYIPYSKLRQIFEKEGRGVFVPYDEFQRLWKAAREAAVKNPDPKPPVSALISEIDSTATVSGDVMSVTAKLQIEVLAAGWHYVHLRLKDAAVRSATIDGHPARLIFEADKGYWVLVEKQGKEAEKIALTLEYSKAFTKQPGTNSVEFEAPQAPVNRWQIRIPEPGVKVHVQPNISSTEVRAQKTDGADSDIRQPVADIDKETLVQAYVAGAAAVRIDWTAKAEGAAGLTALVTVQARQELTIDEGVVRTRVQLAYDIQRAAVSQLVVEVPADHNVANVFDPNVQKWEKKTEGPVQVLTISLFQPTRGSQNVTIDLEKFAGDKDMPQEMTTAEIRAPVVRAVQAGTAETLSAVGRQQGIIVARLGTALRGEATARTGLLQIDAGELPAPLAKQNWPFAYRYAAVPFEGVISVEKLLPLIEVDELAEVFLEPSQITASLLALLNIQRAGIFQTELEVPEGYEVRLVQGREAAGASAIAVDSYHLEGVEYTPNPAQPEVKAQRRTKLVVNFARRALGKVGLWVELIKRQEDANLLQPTGAVSALNLPLPHVAAASVARTSGRLLIYAPESLRINPKEAKGLRAISPAEAVQTIGSTRGDRFAQLRELLAFAYTQEPANLAVEAQRRKPYVEARELIAVHVESGVVRYEATFFYDVKYSGVRALRIDVPAGVAEKIRNLTPALRDQRMDPQPADVASGYVAWQLVGEGELLGSVTAKFTWENKQSDLPVGESVAVDLPQFKVVGVDRFWGQIVASKAETIEISVKDEPKGLRPIDPQRDLMPGAAAPNAARAFEFHDDWALALVATRFQLEEVKRTSIERALVRMVVTRSQKIAVQALYRLRSARQRIPVKLPGVDASNSALALDSQPLRINNQPAPLEHDAMQFYIPLTGHAADEALLVELRYTVDGDPSLLQVPEFPDDPAVQQVDLAVWMPEEWKLLGVWGPWTDESSHYWFDSEMAAGPAEDAALLTQMRQGLSHCDSAGEGFPVDGRRRLFSTLRPEVGAAGALKLTTAHRNVVSAAVFLIISIVGLVLTPLPIGKRLWWLTSVLVAIVLAGIFAPTLAQALIGPPLLLAMGLVLVAWLVRHLAWLVPILAEWIARQSPRAPVASPAPAPVAASEGGAAHA